MQSFEVSKDRGFLPDNDPVSKITVSGFEKINELGANLSKYLISDSLRREIEKLPILDTNLITNQAELRYAMLVYSYLGHGYLWGEGKVVTRFPSSLAVPWHNLATRLGRHPVLSYASYALDNWRRIDPKAEIALGNIALIQTFLGGQDEEWFILIHVDIEAKSGAAIFSLWGAQDFANKKDVASTTSALQSTATALSSMYRSLERMTERCDPYVYFHRVRPYIHGWKNHPLLPNGMLYEGVSAYNNTPQQFRGETGAQSSIIPALDAGLGVGHKDDPMKPYLLEMRDYMPPKHRELLDAFATRADLRGFVGQSSDTNLKNSYNECIEWVQKFRSLHLEYAANYIYKQLEKQKANPSAVGTGGTPFMPYLAKHRDETGAHKL